MKFGSIILLSVTVLGAAATSAIHSRPALGREHIAMTAVPKYGALFQTDPVNIRPREQVNLRFDVLNERGEQVRFLQYVHERPIHLMIVSDDLSEFYHVHPELVTDYFILAQTFPHGGRYHLFVDFTPPGGKRTVEHFTLNVDGEKARPVPLTPDAAWVKTVDGLRVEMNADKPLRAGEDFLLTFSLTDEKTRLPVTDMQLYLGALAHVAIFDQGLTNLIHAHPMDAGEVYDPTQGPQFHTHNPDDAAKKLIGQSPSEVKVPMVLPHAGLYKMWVQFQRNGKVVALPFVIAVHEGEIKEDEAAQPPIDAVLIKITSAGYEPSRIDVTAGEPVKLAFQRSDAQNCGSTVIFPDLNIQRTLAVGKIAVVEFTPWKTGEITFACAMGMYRGVVVVNN